MVYSGSPKSRWVDREKGGYYNTPGIWRVFPRERYRRREEKGRALGCIVRKGRKKPNRKMKKKKKKE